MLFYTNILFPGYSLAHTHTHTYIHQPNQLSCHVNATECKQCCRLDICTCHPFLLLLPLPVTVATLGTPLAYPLRLCLCLHVVQPFFYIIYTLNVVYDAVDTFQIEQGSRECRDGAGSATKGTVCVCVVNVQHVDSNV